MGLYKISFDDGVLEDYENLERKEHAKVYNLLKDIARNGTKGGLGHTEPLGADPFYSGCFSKRADKKNRVIFKITGDTAEIVAVESHYGDK
jgi:Txe/YoeB family toxin of Txe-Axe toxin-antitoxin module